MLKSLSISNYALIDEVNIDFGNGLSVITGEDRMSVRVVRRELGCVCVCGLAWEAEKEQTGEGVLCMEGACVYLGWREDKELIGVVRQAWVL